VATFLVLEGQVHAPCVRDRVPALGNFFPSVVSLEGFEVELELVVVHEELWVLFDGGDKVSALYEVLSQDFLLGGLGSLLLFGVHGTDVDVVSVLANVLHDCYARLSCLVVAVVLSDIEVIGVAGAYLGGVLDVGVDVVPFILVGLSGDDSFLNLSVGFESLLNFFLGSFALRVGQEKAEALEAEILGFGLGIPLSADHAVVGGLKAFVGFGNCSCSLEVLMVLEGIDHLGLLILCN